MNIIAEFLLLSADLLYERWENTIERNVEFYQSYSRLAMVIPIPGDGVFHLVIYRIRICEKYERYF
jgi:hypothetical protein